MCHVSTQKPVKNSLCENEKPRSKVTICRPSRRIFPFENRRDCRRLTNDRCLPVFEQEMAIDREIVVKPTDAGAHSIPMYAQSRNGCPVGPALGDAVVRVPFLLRHQIGDQSG
jgi:hypothetical protein